MYESLTRPVGDPWCFPEAGNSRSQGQRDFVIEQIIKVREAAKQGRSAVQEIGPRLFGWAVDTRMLFEAWNMLAESGGEAPGPNGRTYKDLDSREVWSLLRFISNAAREGRYVRQAALPVSFLKDRSKPERGKRTIWRSNIEDRVVQRAILEVIQPITETYLSETVFGFRPRLGRLHALAYVDRVAFAEDRFVWVKEDLLNAFDRVPRVQLMQAIAKQIPSEDLVDLVHQLVKTDGKRGVMQGGPLAPLMLNGYLATCLDDKWREQFPEAPLVRYADDLLTLCRDTKEAEQSWEELKKILQPTGMKLKGNPGSSIFDLRNGTEVEWLGLAVRRGDQELEVRIAERAWHRLEDHLELAHMKTNSPLRAIDMINGWIGQMGPTYPFVDRDETYDRLESVAQKQAFDEIPSRSAIQSRWEIAYEGYRKLRDGDPENASTSIALHSETEVVFDPYATEGDAF